MADLRTLTRIVEEGGRMLPEDCTPTDLGPALPDRPHHSTDLTTGCGEPLRFRLPYYGENGESREIVACVGDDAAHSWPRLEA